MRRQTSVRALVALMGLLALGCHAEPDDAAGQAGELGDSVRRENAIANLSRLYTTALQNADGDRAAAEPRRIADASVAQLTQTYIDHSEDVTGRSQIVALLGEMRDIRSLPALISALDWRAEVSEENAISAARTLQHMELDAAQKGEVVAAIGAALTRVTQARGVDNRMRIEFLRALGALADPRATPHISRVLLLQSENQDFLINRLACEQLGHLADPASVGALIQALFLFGPNNPALRMNDVASQALVRVGRPALQPLTETLAGTNAEANQIATQYIAAVRQRDATAAAQMSVGSVVSGEAAYALGQLGFREAIDALIRETQQIDEGESPTSIEEDASDEMHMASGALALVSINRDEADTARIRDALLGVYNRLSLDIRPGHPSRPQLLVAFQHFNDAGLQPFLLARAQRPTARGEEEDPNIRILAFRAYAMMANAAEVANLQAILAAEGEGDSKDGFLDFEPTFAVATECDANLACWIGKLGDSNTWVVRKAAYMIARYGRGDAAAITALVGQLGNTDEEVRGEILYALDYVAVHGSPEAVARIDALHAAEQGRAIWSHTESLFLAIQARLAARATSGS